MFQNMQVTSQPVFYLFLAATLLLSLGYTWGKRKNKKIHLSAFNAVISYLRPRDQSFTNIGGLTGYHANIIPKQNKVVRRVDLTLTLLARQSWLYLPFSLITGHTDRLYITFLFRKKVSPSFKEGHIIEKKFAVTSAGKIDDIDSYTTEPVEWGGREFLIHTKEDELAAEFKNFVSRVKEPMGIQQVSYVPDEGKVFVSLIPGYGTVAPVFGPLYDWVLHTFEEKSGKETKKRH